jgi:hypothetical protein
VFVNVGPTRILAADQYALNYRDTGLGLVRKKLAFICSLTDCLERALPERSAMLFDNHDGKSPYYYGFHASRHKSVLLYLDPILQTWLATLEYHWKLYYSVFLSRADTLLQETPDIWFIMETVLTYQDLCSSYLQPEKSSADHVLLILKHWVEISCARAFDFNPSSRTKSKYSGDYKYESSLERLAVMVDSMEELSPSLPPHLRGTSYGYAYRLHNLKTRSQATDQLLYPSCFLERHGTRCQEQAPSIPFGMFEYFGHSMQSLAHRLHGIKWTVWYASYQSELGTRVAGKTYFQQTELAEPLLEQRTSILQEAVLLSLQKAFYFIESIIHHESIRIGCEESCRGAFPESYKHADERRQALLVAIIAEAFATSHRFLDWLAEYGQEGHDPEALYQEFVLFTASPACILEGLENSIIELYLVHHGLPFGIVDVPSQWRETFRQRSSAEVFRD